MNWTKIIESILSFLPIILLLGIIIGFLISEWSESWKNPKMRSFFYFGMDENVKLLG